MKRVSRPTELINAAGNGNFGTSILNVVRPHGSLSWMGIPPLHPAFMTHSTQPFPAASAIPILRAMRQISRVNASSGNAIQQAVNALRGTDLIHNLNWSPPMHLRSSAGLYANAAVSNGHSLSPLNSSDVMSQMLMPRSGISPHFNLPLDEHRLAVSASSGAQPTTPDPPPNSLPTSMSRGLPREGHGKRSFPIILHRALHELDRFPGGGDIAAFLPDGRSFCIKDQQKFNDLVLPVFFPKMKGFASFQRQLNLYDFKRIGGMGPDRGCYRHGLFHRDFPRYLIFMKRRKIKGPLNEV